MASKKWILAAHGSPETLQCIPGLDVKTTPCPPTAVLVRVLTTTATYTDLLICEGNYRPSPPLPLTPGYDCIGVVEEVGVSVPAGILAIGDRVAAMPQASCMSTHVYLPYHAVYKVPAGDPCQQVCAIRTGVTAYQMLHRCCKSRLASPGSGVRLLIHSAAGATGGLLVAIALAAGIPANCIYGTCSARNLPALTALGVNGLDYNDASKDWCQTIVAAGGVEIVFDAVTMNGYFEKSFRCLKAGGKYVSYGFTDTKKPGTLSIPSVLWFFARLSFQQYLTSWFDGGKEAQFYIISEQRDSRPDEFSEDLAAVLDLMASGRVTPTIGKVWEFSECKEALMAIYNNATTGVQCIKVYS